TAGRHRPGEGAAADGQGGAGRAAGQGEGRGPGRARPADRGHQAGRDHARRRQLGDAAGPDQAQPGSGRRARLPARPLTARRTPGSAVVPGVRLSSAGVRGRPSVGQVRAFRSNGVRVRFVSAVGGHWGRQPAGGQVGTGIDGSPRLGAVMPLEPGDPRTIGRYGLTGRLGTGGMGTVYLGRALGGGPPVAVKVVHAELAGDPEFRARFADEVAAARRVAPFCTARVVDADPAARAPYLVTEFVDGVPLNVAVSDGGPLDESTLHGVALGVAAALSAVHAAGVVHRDLKPANVLLSLSGPRVIDFGIARALDVARRHTQAGMLVGTPGWMAPEQFRDGTVGPAADVFSWGSLVAYAATGHNPWSHAQSGPSLSPTEQ